MHQYYHGKIVIPMTSMELLN